MCSLQKRGRVYILTLTGDGEHRLNADVIASIRSALAKIRAESLAAGAESFALVTAGEGRFFSNGLDLAWASEEGSPSAFRARLGHLVEIFRPVVADLMSLPMPTIAAVTGHAAAAGFMLALSHDYLFMREDRGVLYMSELNIGLPFPPYFMVSLRSKIADRRALRDVTAAKISAAEGKERGIVDSVHGSAAETLEAAIKKGEQLAARNWNGKVYASIRMGAFSEMCKAVGLEEDDDVVKGKQFASKF